MGIAITKGLIKEEFSQLKDAMEEGDVAGVAAKINKEMELLNNTTLRIGITGCSGAGKSSLVNALREMADDEEDSAPTGVKETTKDVQAYQHPKFPKVIFFDMPGIGTSNFKAAKYLKQVNFSQYDFFIIAGGDRFTENDVKLACEIKKMKKMYYFVRTQVDKSIDSEKKKKSFNEEKTLEEIRNYCMENLKESGEHPPRVFLITRWDLSKYDFPLLVKALEEGLDDVKKHVLIMALPAFSKEAIQKKENAMISLIWKLSFVSCAIGATPIPGLSLACDTAILVGAMITIYKSFGLDEDTLRRFGERVGKPVDELKSAVKKTPRAGRITKEFAIDYLQKSAVWVTVTVIELVLDFVPIVGSVIGGGASFVTTFYMLKNFLRDVVEDAHNVLKKAQEKKE
nr:interferon-inducible GTPase 5-like [Anolis sagrei ordinatus]